MEMKLRISGRIRQRGITGSVEDSAAPQSIILEKEKWQNIYNHFRDSVLALGSDDLVITGANAIDGDGNVLVMAPSPVGNPGRSISAATTEGPPHCAWCRLREADSWENFRSHWLTRKKNV